MMSIRVLSGSELVGLVEVLDDDAIAEVDRLGREAAASDLR